MKNAKVEESVQAYLEMNTTEGRNMVLRIVLPQLNNEEKTEFTNQCINALDQELKSIKTPSTQTMICLQSAMMYFMSAFTGLVKLRMATMIIFLFICLFAGAQNFSKVDKRGMTKEQIADTCGKVAWCRSSNIFEGEQADIYTGLDFGSVMYIFNKTGKCYKMRIKNDKNTPIIFDDKVIWSAKSDEYTTEYIIN
jgi:hypothetical protein